MLATSLGMTLSEGPVHWYRKHYVYPDLPSSYQLTSEPLATGGLFNGVKLTELHLEIDPGRYELGAGTVDYNRCHTCLVELVTEPDLFNPSQAARFFDDLLLHCRYLGILRDEAGSSRSDVNVSLDNGSRTETKNVNSSTAIQTVIEHEVVRQRRILDSGERVEMETRGYVESDGSTIHLRSKETVVDYRFMICPDVYPLLFTEDEISSTRNDLLSRGLMIQPEQRIQTLLTLGIPKARAQQLVKSPTTFHYFEELISNIPESLVSDSAEFLLNTVQHESQAMDDSFPWTPVEIGIIVTALSSHQISSIGARRILRELPEREKTLEQFLHEHALSDVGSEEELSRLIQEILYQETRALADYQNLLLKQDYRRAERVSRYLLGSVFRELGSKIDTDIVSAIVRTLLEERSIQFE
jgi:aspartyl-tRNA(Asn)/glutamyl-tRNA(Gln) amidotransferase subunit B